LPFPDSNIGYAKKLFESGAKGYLSKNSSKEEMMVAITEVFKGNKYLSREIIDNLAETLLEPAKDLPNILSLCDR
jgi:DNA-binding NarL/FixJ family response regulator